jgi:hypothetical protein
MQTTRVNFGERKTPNGQDYEEDEAQEEKSSVIRQ